MTVVAIAVGSAAGGVLRHVTTEAVTRLAGAGFPWGTLIVNVTGSLVMGVCLGLWTLAVPAPWSPVARHAAMTGVLGGFTTFSAFSLQTMGLLQQGHWTAAAANAVASVGLSVLACGAGYSAVSIALR